MVIVHPLQELRMTKQSAPVPVLTPSARADRAVASPGLVPGAAPGNAPSASQASQLLPLKHAIPPPKKRKSNPVAIARRSSR